MLFFFNNRNEFAGHFSKKYNGINSTDRESECQRNVKSCIELGKTLNIV